MEQGKRRRSPRRQSRLRELRRTPLKANNPQHRPLCWPTRGRRPPTSCGSSMTRPRSVTFPGYPLVDSARFYPRDNFRQCTGNPPPPPFPNPLPLPWSQVSTVFAAALEVVRSHRASQGVLNLCCRPRPCLLASFSKTGHAPVDDPGDGSPINLATAEDLSAALDVWMGGRDPRHRLGRRSRRRPSAVVVEVARTPSEAFDAAAESVLAAAAGIGVAPLRAAHVVAEAHAIGICATFAPLADLSAALDALAGEVRARCGRQGRWWRWWRWWQ